MGAYSVGAYSVGAYSVGGHSVGEDSVGDYRLDYRFRIRQARYVPACKRYTEPLQTS